MDTRKESDVRIVNRQGISHLLILVGTLFLVGCSPALTKQFVHIGEFFPNNALIYVMKTGKFLCGGSTVRILDGPLVVGELGPNGYIVWARPAGRAELYAYYPVNKFLKPIPLVIDIKPSTSYYISVETKASLSGTGQVILEVTSQ
jgi:hypothetical protein